MSLHDHALYQVATKGLVFDGNKVLVLITPDGYIDFPGGRVDESERLVPWTDSLNREITEEIGESIVVEIGQTLFVSKRHYQRDGQSHHIAAIFFSCQYVSGPVMLSNEHGSFEWLSLDDLVHDDRKFVSDDEKNHLVELLNQRTTN